MIGMAALPVGKNDYARALLANDAGDLDAVGVGVLDAAIGNVEGFAPCDLQNTRCFGGFGGAALGGAARSQFALREVENAGARALTRHLQQRAATGLLHVVAMGGDGEHVEGGRVHFLRSTRKAAISRRSLDLSPTRSSAALA